MAKKVAISGYYGFKNFGDETILSVLVEKLNELGVDITVFSSDPEWTKKTYNVNSVQSFDLKSVIKTLRDADVLISGGGSLLQDVTTLKSLIYYALVIFAALVLKKKVVIFAQGIGPINCKIALFFVIQLLKRCVYVSVRDEKSLELLKKHGVPAKLVCDPLYTLNIPSKKCKACVGVQLRDFKTMNIDFINHLAMHVAKNFSDRTIKLFSLQDTLDLNVCEEFLHALKILAPDNNVEIISGCSNQELIDELSKLEYLIAMRFHAILIGLKAKVKTLAINYDVKVERLADEAQLPYISLNDFSNFDEKFKEMNLLDMQKTSDYCKSKEFDWKGVFSGF